jgi:tetratricopeptide (TPR) repeat protein
VELLRRCVELDPGLDWAYAELGEALRMLERYEEALRALDKALEIDNNSYYTLGIKGGVLHALERYTDALSVLDATLALKQDDSFALLNKGQVLDTLDRHDEALKVFNQALKYYPTDPTFLRSKGYSLLSLGRKEEALAAFDQALKIQDGSSAWLLADKAYVFELSEDYEQALGCLGQALTHDNNNVWALYISGSVLGEITAYEQAVRVLNKALSLETSNPRMFDLKGWALENLGEGHFEEALKAYQAAAGLDPSNPWYHKGIGNALHLLRLEGEAEGEYLKAIDLTGSHAQANAEIIWLKGWCNYRLGKYEAAANLYLEALSLDPSLASTRFDLALAWMCLGNLEQCLTDYRLGLEFIKPKQKLRRYALLEIALRDFERAQSTLPTNGSFVAAKKLLLEAYADCDGDDTSILRSQLAKLIADLAHV